MHTCVAQAWALPAPEGAVVFYQAPISTGAEHDQNCFAEGAQSGSPYKNQPLSTLESNPYEGKPGRKPSAEVQTNYFKLRLMECIAGLDRGFAANSYAAMQVESAALALTEQSEPVTLSWTAGESSLQRRVDILNKHSSRSIKRSCAALANCFVASS